MFIKSKFSGIDFNDNSISFATVKLERGIPVIHDVGKQEVNKEIITGGLVSQSKLITSALKDILSGGRLSKNVHLAIPTQNILVRKITSLPDIGEDELAKILKFQIGESIHLPFENPVYDFVKIGSILPNVMEKNDGVDEDDELLLNELATGSESNIEGPKSELLLFATSRILSQELADACATAGLKPMSAEIRALALQRLLFYTHPNWLKNIEMIIDVSENSIDIHIFKESLIVFSRMMSINSRDFSFSADNELGDEMLLFEKEIPRYMDSSNLEIAATTDEELDSFGDSYINDVVLEIEKAQNFFRYSFGERDSEFTRIIVTGEKANQVFEHLNHRIKSSMIERIDYCSIIEDNLMNKDLLDTCSVAIGLAIRANEKR